VRSTSWRYHQLESDFADDLVLLFSTPPDTITAPTDSGQTDPGTEDDTVMRDAAPSTDAGSGSAETPPTMGSETGDDATAISSVMGGLSLKDKSGLPEQ
jgi:hypothetical protein